jgi:hypothetical protein
MILQGDKKEDKRKMKKKEDLESQLVLFYQELGATC